MGCAVSTPVAPATGVMPDATGPGSPPPGAKGRELLAFAQSPGDKRRILAEAKVEPLTDEEKKQLQSNPQGWMDPDFFALHMNDIWRHYSNDIDGDDDKRIIDRDGAALMARDAVDRWTTIFSDRVRKKSSHKKDDVRFKQDLDAELADYLPGSNHDQRIAHVQFYFLSKVPLGGRGKDGSPLGERSKITFNEFMFNFSNAYNRLFNMDAGDKKRQVLSELSKGYRDKMKRLKKKGHHGGDGLRSNRDHKKDGTLVVSPKTSDTNDVKSFRHEEKKK